MDGHGGMLAVAVWAAVLNLLAPMRQCDEDKAL